MALRFLHPLLALLACLLLVVAPICALGQVRVAEETIESSEKLPGEEKTENTEAGSPLGHRQRVARPLRAAHVVGELDPPAPVRVVARPRPPTATPCWAPPLRC